MFYRETGVLKTTYAKDMELFPIPLDKVGFGVAMVLAFLVIPLVSSHYMLVSIFIPFLVFSLAALGLNILTGYAGQLSLGHAGFMAVGAYATVVMYNRYDVPIPVALLGSGIITAAVGSVFGLPSLRIKGFYLAVSTLAAQLIIEWVITHVKWISGGVYSTIDIKALELLGWQIDTAAEKYYFALIFVVIMAFFAKNVVRSRIGRAWMSIRDMDVASEIIGISQFRYKMLAFAVSSFYAGVAGGLLVAFYYGSANIEEFHLLVSFQILGMVIIGGMGSVLGSFLGAAFIVLLPIFINLGISFVNHRIVDLSKVFTLDLMANTENMIFGALIIFFLAVEPFGLARLWNTIKDYLRLWPFPY
ncbi:MAG: branched-chain amino acid ABC transporter permease [Thermodesulfobacteriota bacterium]